MPRQSTVLISYAHGDQAFQDRVLAFADRLEVLGLNVLLDQYEPNPAQGWTKWMVDGVRKSDYVLSICTPEYHARVNEDQEPGTGLGVQWEGTAIYNLLQTESEQRNKVLVIQFDRSNVEHIPLPMRGNNRFLLSEFDLGDSTFEDLYRLLTDQPRVQRPERGQIVVLKTRNAPSDVEKLPPKERDTIPRSNVPAQEQPTGTMSMQSFGAGTPSASAKKGKGIGKPKGEGTWVQRKASEMRRQAWYAIYDDRFEEAKELAREAERFDGSIKTAALIDAFIHFKAEEWDSAARAYGEASAHAPLNPSSLMAAYVSKQLAGHGDYRQPMNDLLEVNPTDVDLLISYGRWLHRHSKDEEIRDFYSEAYQRTKHPLLRAEFAIFEWKKGNFSRANELLEQAVEQNSTAELWANLGVARAELRRYGLAIEALRKAMELRPRFLFARYALAEVYALMGDAKAAVAVLKEAASDGFGQLHRVKTERTFDPIRHTPEFQQFIEETFGAAPAT